MLVTQHLVDPDGQQPGQISGGAVSFGDVHRRSIQAQINTAFRNPPNIANTLHGLRHINQGARGRRTSLFPSRKAGGAVPVESKLELAYAIELERSASVLSYRTQAVHIQLPAGQSAFPDFLIQTTDGRFELHEVKPSVAHLPANYFARVEMIRCLLRAEGIAFYLVDAEQLPSVHMMSWLLQCYTRGHSQAWTDAQIRLAIQTLASCARVSLPEAYRRLSNAHLPPQLADYLAFHRGWFASARHSLQEGV